MTEDEAKTKWCPFVRAASATSDDLKRAEVFGPSINRVAVPGEKVALPVVARCIASACMAWRFDRVERDATGRPARDWPGLAPFLGPDTHVFVHGYCGLAGTPQ